MAQTLHSLLHAVGLPVAEDLPNPELEALTCDSRFAGHGALFIGLPGERVDGGSFWRQTLTDGAAAAVIGVAAAEADPPDQGAPPLKCYYDVSAELVERQREFRRLRKTSRDTSHASLASLGVVVDFLQRRMYDAASRTPNGHFRCC